MSTETIHQSNTENHPLLVICKDSPVIQALEKSILAFLEDYNGLCMDDEKDRQTLASELAPMILIELFGFTEWGSVSTD